MNQQPGLIPQGIKDKSLDLLGLLFVLLIIGHRYKYQEAAALGLILAIPAGAIWIYHSRTNNRPVQIPAYSWVYLPLILSGILAVVNSIRPSLSLEELLIWAFNLMMVGFVINRKDKRGLLICLLIAGILYAQAQIPSIIEGIGIHRPANPNNAGALLNVFITSSLAIIFNSNTDTPNRTLAVVCWSLSSAVMLTTASRAAIMAGIAADVVVIIISNGWKSQMGWFWIVLSAGSRLSQIAGIFLLRSNIPDSVIPLNLQASTVPRVAIYQSAWEIFKANPIMGAGLKSFLLINQLNGPVNTGKYIHAHNIYLSILVQMGLVGFVAVALSLTATSWHILKECPDQMIKAAAIAAIVTMLVHGLLDNPYFEPYNMRAILIPLALAIPSKSLSDKMSLRGA